MPDIKSEQKKEDILQVALERFKLAAEAESENRKLALEDLKFRAGDQWDSDIRSSREQDKRPCLTINKLPQFVRQVTNDQRQNRPSIKVNPVDDKADIETAKVYQGLIRHIEYNSNADVAYDTAFEGAATKGLGYFRIVTDYATPTSFNQEILIKRIRDSMSVYVDPFYQEPDGSDMNWGFIVEDMSAEEFKAQYPDSELCKMQDWASLGDNVADWINQKGCRVAEYFYKTFKESTIYLLSNGQTVTDLMAPEVLPAGVTIVKDRKAILPAIKWVKINGIEILEETDWSGSYIPIIPVLGDEIIVDGKRILEGIVRHAKDPQKMYNYWSSSQTETIALAPRAPWVGVAGQFKGFENQWKTANTRNHAYLEFNAVSINGQPAPAPQRNFGEPPIQAISIARADSSEDMKATTGIYDASLGNRSNENSGIAIQRRNMQAQTNNFHYVDNLSRSIKHAGRIIVELIPVIYDTPQMVRILGEDGTPEIVQVNKPFEKNGQQMIHQLNVGRYDVTVATGPSYATKRQEAVASLLDFLKVYPQAAQFVGDLLAKNMDWPGAQEIQDRLKKMLPPQIADDGKDANQPLPPQVSAQMQQMNQMIEMLTKQLNAANEKIENKTLELESKERIENQKIQANIEIELAKMGSKDAQFLMEQEIAEIERRQSLLNYEEPIGNESMAEPDQFGQGMNQNPTGGESPGQFMGG